MKNCSVLVVEDEYYFRQALIKSINNFGPEFYVCGESRDGKEAFALIQSIQPDIALIDINIPIINGIDLICALREAKVFTKIIILTGYNEHEYIRSAFKFGVKDYLLKPIADETLLSCLQRVREEINTEKTHRRQYILNKKRQLAQRLLRGEGDRLEVQEYLLLRYCKYYATIILQTKPGTDLHAKSLESLETIIEERTLASGYQALMCINEHNLFCCILLATQAGYEAYCQMPDKVHHIFNSLFEQDVLINCSMGLFHSGADGARMSYTEAVLAGSNLTIRKKGQFAVYKNENELTFPSFKRQISKQIQEFSNNIALKQTDKAKTFVLQSFAWLEAHAISNWLFQWCIIQIWLALIDEAVSKNVALPFHTFERLYMPVQDQDIEFHKNQLLKAVSVCTNLCDSKGENYRDIITAVNEYIEQHYHEADLKLPQIASSQYISVQYLCAVYKKQTGSTVGDYITEKRLQKAIALLDEGVKNISSLANLCGYEDPAYFSRSFKKRFGMSPSQYITSHAR